MNILKIIEWYWKEMMFGVIITLIIIIIIGLILYLTNNLHFGKPFIMDCSNSIVKIIG